MSRFSVLVAWVIGMLVLFFAGSSVHAQVACGVTITQTVALEKDLICNTPIGLVVEGPAGQLDLKGHTVRCVSGNNTHGIVLAGEQARVTNGAVTGCESGVVAGEGGQHHIVGVKSREHAGSGFTTGGVDGFLRSNGNFFFNNHAENCLTGFHILSNQNLLAHNTSSENKTGYILTQDRNKLVLNSAKHNTGQGFYIASRARDNHLIKNFATENFLEGFAIEGHQNKLVKNHSAGNGGEVMGAGFRISEANKNLLFYNVSENNSGNGFEIEGFFTPAGNNVLRGNTAKNNKDVGIALHLLAENNFLIQNTAVGNAMFDLQSRSLGCFANQWVQNTSETADPQECIQSD